MKYFEGKNFHKPHLRDAANEEALHEGVSEGTPPLSKRLGLQMYKKAYQFRYLLNQIDFDFLHVTY